MTQRDRYSTAVHEAGHIVVAFALGLKTRTVAIGINGDDTAGKAEIQTSSQLPLVDRIAICSAGADAQLMLNASLHDLGAIMDMNEIQELVEDYPEGEAEAAGYAGCCRSKEILDQHRATLERLAQALEERSELNQIEIDQILEGQ